MKKLLVVLLAAVMVFAFATSAFAYTDTDELSRVERDAIYGLSALGILEGYGEGVFGPELTVTRAEMAKITCYLGGFGETASNYVNTATRYSDVPATHWAAGYIAAADSFGYVKGYPDGTFKPSQTVSMQEALTMMLRVAGYTDELAGPWPFDYIAQGAKLGVTDDVSFTGTAAGRRANIAVMGWNLLDQNIVYYNETKGTFVAIDWSTFGDVYYDDYLARFGNPTVFDNFDADRIQSGIIAEWSISDYDEKEVSVALLTDLDWEEQELVRIAGRALADDCYISDGLYFYDIEGYTAKVFYDKDPDETDAQIIYIGLENEVQYSDDVEVRDASRNVIRVDGKEVSTVDDNILYWDEDAWRFGDIDDVEDGAYKLWYNRSGKLYAVHELPTELEIMVFDEYDKDDEYVYAYFGTGELESIDVDGDEVVVLKDGQIYGLEDLKAGEVLSVDESWFDGTNNRGVDAVLYYPEILSGKLVDATSSDLTIGDADYEWADPQAARISTDDFKEWAEMADPDELDDAYDETVKYILINPYKVGYIAYGEPAATTKTVYGIVEDADTGASGRVRELTIRDAEDNRVRYDMDYVINWGNEDGDLHEGAFVEMKVKLSDNVVDEVVNETDADKANMPEAYGDAANTFEGDYYSYERANDTVKITVAIDDERVVTAGDGKFDIVDSTIVFNVTTDAHGDFDEAIAITGKEFKTMDSFTCDAYLMKVDSKGDIIVLAMVDGDILGGYNYGILEDVRRTSGTTKVTIDDTAYVYDDDEYTFAQLSDMENKTFVEFILRNDEIVEINPLVSLENYDFDAINFDAAEGAVIYALTAGDDGIDFETGGATQYADLYVNYNGWAAYPVIPAEVGTRTINDLSPNTADNYRVNNSTRYFAIDTDGTIDAIKKTNFDEAYIILVTTNDADGIAKFVFVIDDGTYF